MSAGGANSRTRSLLPALKEAFSLERRWQQWVVGLSAVVFVIAFAILSNLRSEFAITVTLALLFILLSAILLHVSAIQAEVGQLVFEHERAADVAQKAALEGGSDELKMLEYSGDSVRGILESAAASSKIKSVKLLVFDPRAAGDFQQGRILSSLQNIAMIFADREDLDLRIRCYDKGPSLRGRLYGNRHVAVGWYTFERRPRVDPENRVWGGPNPVVVADCRDPQGFALQKMFDRVFVQLWEEESVPLKEAAPALRAPPGWLDRVSGVAYSHPVEEFGARSGPAR